MKSLFVYSHIIFIRASCDADQKDKSNVSDTVAAKHTFIYPYQTSYSSDHSISFNNFNAQRVLTVWKMYENKQMDAMKPYYADTVTYRDAGGNYYYSPSKGLPDIATKKMNSVDSLRFDISSRESVHSNDRNEDRVNI